MRINIYRLRLRRSRRSRRFRCVGHYYHGLLPGPRRLIVPERTLHCGNPVDLGRCTVIFYVVDTMQRMMGKIDGRTSMLLSQRQVLTT